MEADSFATLVKLASKLNLESSEASQVVLDDFLQIVPGERSGGRWHASRTIAVIDDDFRVIES
jgi:hypothetical protein